MDSDRASTRFRTALARAPRYERQRFSRASGAILLAAFFLASSTPLFAADRDSQTPDGAPKGNTIYASVAIFSQLVVFRIPEGWKSAHQQANQTFYILELIPKDEALESWTEMLTVQGFRNMALEPGATPELLLSAVGEKIRKACPEQYVAQSFGKTKIDSLDAHLAIIGCASMPAGASYGSRQGQSEIGYFVAIQASRDMYLIHRSKRDDALDKSKPPMSAANAEKLLESLQPIKVCERSEPQAACWNRSQR